LTGFPNYRVVGWLLRHSCILLAALLELWQQVFEGGLCACVCSVDCDDSGVLLYSCVSQPTCCNGRQRLLPVMALPIPLEHTLSERRSNCHHSASTIPYCTQCLTALVTLCHHHHQFTTLSHSIKCHRPRAQPGWQKTLVTHPSSRPTFPHPSPTLFLPWFPNPYLPPDKEAPQGFDRNTTVGMQRTTSLGSKTFFVHWLKEPSAISCRAATVQSALYMLQVACLDKCTYLHRFEVC
jgi:hypothetical protein